MSANDNTSKKEMIKVQSSKQLKQVVSTRSRCGAIAVLIVGFLSVYMVLLL